jgi:hypothetical protein
MNLSLILAFLRLESEYIINIIDFFLIHDPCSGIQRRLASPIQGFARCPWCGKKNMYERSKSMHFLPWQLGGWTLCSAEIMGVSTPRTP